jgi:hypothetical protein
VLSIEVVSSQVERPKVDPDHEPTAKAVTDDIREVLITVGNASPQSICGKSRGKNPRREHVLETDIEVRLVGIDATAPSNEGTGSSVRTAADVGSTTGATEQGSPGGPLGMGEGPQNRQGCYNGCDTGQARVHGSPLMLTDRGRPEPEMNSELRVPIWKKELYAEGDADWVEGTKLG